MDQRYDFDERIKRIELKLMWGAIFSASLGIAVGSITFLVMYQFTAFFAILGLSAIAIAAISHLVYRAMD